MLTHEPPSFLNELIEMLMKVLGYTDCSWKAFVNSIKDLSNFLDALITFETRFIEEEVLFNL